jgi:deoxyribodipyrimidine photolyase
MSAALSTGIVWFKNTDLRLMDNAVIKSSHEDSSDVFHTYIIDPQTFLSPTAISNNCKYSMKRFEFLSQTLEDLHKKLCNVGNKLHIFVGPSEVVLEKLMTSLLVNPTLFFHDEYIHEEKLLVSKVMRSIPSTHRRVKTYWGGGTLFEPSDLSYPLEEFGPFTIFRQEMEKLQIREPLPLPDVMKPSPNLDEAMCAHLGLLSCMTSQSIFRSLTEVALACGAQEDPLFQSGSFPCLYTGGESAALERLDYYITQGKLICCITITQQHFNTIFYIT